MKRRLARKLLNVAVTRLLVVCITCSVSGCAGWNVAPAAKALPDAVLWDSDAYRERQRAFTLSLEDAGRRLRDAMRDRGRSEYLQAEMGFHYVIVGESYVFTPRYSIRKTDPILVPLWGAHVNGRTGEIRWVEREPDPRRDMTVHGFGEDATGELYALVTNTPANGTGGIVYQLVAVPEPGTAALGLIGLTMLALRRQR